jgi:hypothetical protein
MLEGQVHWQQAVCLTEAMHAMTVELLLLAYKNSKRALVRQIMSEFLVVIVVITNTREARSYSRGSVEVSLQ